MRWPLMLRAANPLVPSGNAISNPIRWLLPTPHNLSRSPELDSAVAESVTLTHDHLTSAGASLVDGNVTELS